MLYIEAKDNKGEIFMNILVTGATGDYGSHALAYLKKFAPNDNLFALARSKEKAQSIKQDGVTVRLGDFSDKTSMVEALKDIDRLLFVSVPTPGIQKNVVDAAKEDNVKFIAYTSIFAPEYSQFGLEQNHSETEQWIKDSGIPYTFLRNSWYLEVNQAMFEYAQKTGKFPYFAGNGKIALTYKKDYAEAGARAVASGKFGPVLNLSSQPLTYRELGLATQEALGKSIDIEETSESDFNKDLASAGISSTWATIADTYQKYTKNGNNGQESATTADFEKALGHPITKLSDAIKDILN
ncbi:hypothetical protein FC27_GL000299 [Companilactobacillus versmoldensis DSM 14857 = KCTC 3814]|uniref:NAD(P)-binding domain-containing protein n=2 Tax=Companilactobacillus versmoldensis TaxID=194326 RepID=A0A0R1SKQ0_9LACO|nr:hypothetical protein FC27_GL000299 [Companilactobacillus versmoldensis DSM 14857 = KCTC 3814]